VHKTTVQNQRYLATKEKKNKILQKKCENFAHRVVSQLFLDFEFQKD